MSKRPPICKLCNKPFWDDKASTDATVCVCSNTVNKEFYKANLIKELEKHKKFHSNGGIIEGFDQAIELIKQT